LKSLEDTIKELKGIPLKIAELEMRVERLEEKDRSNARKVWEIVRLILASLIGGLISYLVRKLS